VSRLEEIRDRLDEITLALRDESEDARRAAVEVLNGLRQAGRPGAGAHSL